MNRIQLQLQYKHISSKRYIFEEEMNKFLKDKKIFYVKISHTQLGYTNDFFHADIIYKDLSEGEKT